MNSDFSLDFLFARWWLAYSGEFDSGNVCSGHVLPRYRDLSDSDKINFGNWLLNHSGELQGIDFRKKAMEICKTLGFDRVAGDTCSGIVFNEICSIVAHCIMLGWSPKGAVCQLLVAWSRGEITATDTKAWITKWIMHRAITSVEEEQEQTDSDNAEHDVDMDANNFNLIIKENNNA